MFSFRPATSWYIRLDTFHVVSKDRVAAALAGTTPASLSSTDKMYAAYFTLEDYYEVKDYLGTLYDWAQISRILDLPAYSSYPVLASKFAVGLYKLKSFDPPWLEGVRCQIVIHVI